MARTLDKEVAAMLMPLVQLAGVAEKVVQMIQDEVIPKLVDAVVESDGGIDQDVVAMIVGGIGALDDKVQAVREVMVR